MNDDDEKLSQQMIAARQVMDKHREALSALAGNEISPELRRKMEVARERMEKYRTVYRALSK